MYTETVGGQPTNFDIVCYKNDIPDFENYNNVTNLKNTQWELITSIDESNFISSKKSSYRFDDTSAKFFAIKISTTGSDNLKFLDINWTYDSKSTL